MVCGFVSEYRYLGGNGADFIEIVLPEGTDPSTVQVVVYRANGAIRSTNDLTTPTSTAGGKDVYVLENGSSATFNGLVHYDAVALVIDGVVVSFHSFSDTAATVTATTGPAAGMTSTEIGQAGTGSSLSGTCNGEYVVTTPPTEGVFVPCFTPGAKIATPTGECLVENLKVGDLVITRDHGLQAIRWVGHKHISRARLMAFPELNPVLISKGSLDGFVPNEDLLVSPQHRMVFKTPDFEQKFGVQEALVPAKALTCAKTIYNMLMHEITYIHLLLDKHEVIFANGAETESFHPGDAILSAMDEDVAQEIYDIFPELEEYGENAYGQTAIMAMSVQQGFYAAQDFFNVTYDQ